MKINSLQIILFIGSIIFILLLWYLYKVIKKSNHFNSFSLVEDKEDYSFLNNLSKKIWFSISNLSTDLSKYKIIKRLANPYEKYILYVERNYKKKEDYLTIKIIFIIVMLILNSLLMLLEIIPASIFSIIVSFLMGYFLPDFIWQYKYQIRLNKINQDLYLMIKNLNIELKNNSINNALDATIKIIDNPLKDELEKVKSDLSYGISLEEAFNRFYKRSKLEDLRVVVDYLRLGEENNILLQDIFNSLDNYFLKEYKRKEKFNSMTNFYNYIFIISLIIPLFIYILGVSINLEYFIPLFNSYKGYIILILIILVYSIYIFIIKELLEVKDE